MSSFIPITSPIQAIALSLLFTTATYLYTKLKDKRLRQYAHLPQLPTSLLWGHLKLFDEYTKHGPEDRHPDAIIAEMHKDLGSPPLFLLDMRPINPPMVIIANHELAEQISKPSTGFPYSVHKAPSVERMASLIGPSSILFHQNEDWKAVRRRFSPGFAPNHLTTLLPDILNKSIPFLEHLDRYAQSGEVFKLTNLTTNLTFDIIGAVAMDVDLEAQQPNPPQGGLIFTFKELIRTFADDKLHFPWWLIPFTAFKRYRLSTTITKKLQEIVCNKFAELKSSSADSQTRTILALSLQDVECLTPSILNETCDQLKTFLFAGHDTTSILIDWAVYELSRTPKALSSVQAEVSRLFGPDAHDPKAIQARLLSPGGDSLIHRMTYISAVIRETLRVHSPAGSIRMVMPGSGSTCVVSTPSGEYCLDGTWMYINHTIIHSDPAVFGDTASEFRPERWLANASNVSIDDPSESSETIFTAASGAFPPSTWRPFERGPRNCIGQELANIEARIIIAMLAYRYAFSKIGLGELDSDSEGRPKLDHHSGQYQVKSELYPTIQITAKPVDGMLMKVEFASAKTNIANAN